MKQNAQQIRTQLLTVIMAGVAGVGFASTVTAAGVGVGFNTNVGAGTQVATNDHAQARGYADLHMSTTGSGISNAQWQSEVTRDADRATERMGTNDDGESHSTLTEVESISKAVAKAGHLGTR